MMNELSMVQRFVVWVLPVVFAITVHEVAHGWMAKKYGDNTAFLQGRLTLNPIKHIDWLGTVIIPGILLLTFTGFIFGWAKPVPVDARNFKNPKQNMAIVALAGPVSNILMATGWALLARLGVMLNMDFVSLPLIYTGIAGITINLVLALLNLLPIPPLDGSRILTGLLPNRWAWYYNSLERFGFIILIVLMYTGVLQLVLGYPMFVIQKLFFDLAGL
ncbi:MAG: site-2 protease family protein [Methylicorpusculum sp.]|uniref:site-2 protease family protein n=1 Tax=Methylicorpusculum sp. TaxID=2713644 RepID=UPI0027198110|nr:site-2 protease family protein [Methylicorpusculum sp.]MDO8845845.1 site-2 protease family protein [Methylicorpusculum sp.]MDO8939349.1 site-2 protease family protein [Methylicorpusculum sp.]MDO9241160.1 site-2 protease family protein [Methylicorpusculum sp.]MDP2180906.1 site-2 protease family protein [Methylicorpusculum sp.]MDP2201709.1 site-2 protease family protein [Methylicorpusculum sp.]